ncbi:dTDP-4-dehydrorhamnose reductase [Conexibacter sp. CPCC 206217]|uniref:dTDP-4-dehydrorhamnose reductase n=1 Tax=Conexibacter sp. CPCC 206217 TaxID=3064574 RepID=UPI00271B55A5|nr:dTDP-4-dehydrorhamnose reductase [Conexibacter sp. CPCC 206217]MDO8213734.1 dTDP-4-dehydrorhamnose reductase [Conexibacter sp. CPCC 206217]
MSPRLLVTGAHGMLGRDVVRIARADGHDVVALARAELDVTDAAAVSAAISAAAPDAVVNCAAWTNVDGAESDPDGAAAVNATAAGNVARAAAAAGARLVHVSTDYVFDGARAADAAPYVESDPTNPQSVYGRTKLAGEQAVAAAGGSHAIVRSSWLFGVGGPNFAATMLRLAAERDEISVVTDQIGCPTATADLARALLTLAFGAGDGDGAADGSAGAGAGVRAAQGVFHVAGSGPPVSWNAFAAEIFRQAGAACRVLPCTTAEMPRPAPRPAFSALASARPETPVLPPWQDGLSDFLEARKVHA